jgi:hypothetical protein
MEVEFDPKSVCSTEEGLFDLASGSIVFAAKQGEVSLFRRWQVG